jgi:hypothetical protein
MKEGDLSDVTEAAGITRHTQLESRRLGMRRVLCLSSASLVRHTIFLSHAFYSYTTFTNTKKKNSATGLVFVTNLTDAFAIVTDFTYLSRSDEISSLSFSYLESYVKKENSLRQPDANPNI